MRNLGERLADLLCTVCVCVVIFAALGGVSDGLSVREAKSLAGLGLLAGLAGLALEGKCRRSK